MELTENQSKTRIALQKKATQNKRRREKHVYTNTKFEHKEVQSPKEDINVYETINTATKTQLEQNHSETNRNIFPRTKRCVVFVSLTIVLSIVLITTLLIVLLTKNNDGAHTTTQVANTTTQVRLVGGSSNGTGRLEIFYNGNWLTVYGSYYFQIPDATVVCRLLGFGNSSVVYIFKNAYQLFGEGTGEVLNHKFNCKGNETDLRQCGSGVWSVQATYEYSHTTDVGISCEPTKIRLVDGDSATSGRVEVIFNGIWSSVCDSDFGDTDARVICNMLGYRHTTIVKAFSGSHFGQGVGTIMLSSLSCKGTETDIKSCFPQWGASNCNHKNEAGVRCGSTQIRLVNGPSNSSGRVEVFHGGQWGTICGSRGLSSRDVAVVCKMLGYNDPKAFGFPHAFYGEGFGNVIIERLNCDGSEPDIAMCQEDAWQSTTGYCDHSYDIGVNCDGKTHVRLMGGTSEQSGRVEIFHNGHWGTVSDTNFDMHDLAVICSMLGYQYTSKSFFGSHYGQGIGEIVVTDLRCNGAETDIGKCKATWWPKTVSHSHANDVGVNCDGKMPIKLVDGNRNASGMVAILYNGLYGTICSRSFNRFGLVVVCRMLGFDDIPKSAYWHPAASYAHRLGEMVVSDLKCNGMEHTIGQCGGTWPASSSYCDHSMDLFVNCDGAAEQIRLVNGTSKHSGRVEIFHSGQWATICNEVFDKSDAVVICRILNYPNPEDAVAYKSAHFGQGNSSFPIAMTSLRCNGLETNLGQCNPSWNSLYCRHYQDISVDCCPNCQDVIV